MSGQEQMDGVPAVSAKWRAIALLAIVFLGIVLIVAVFFAMKKPESGRVTKIYEGDAAVVNTGAIVDGTDPAVRVTPQVGYRYRVFVEDESDDRASGIARLGGRATFIDGARRGQTCIVDVTRVQDRVVNANLVKVVSEISLPPKAPREPYKPKPGDRSAFVVDDAVLDVVISEASSKNPDGEGVAKVEGLVVFVEGATKIGERVNVRIVQRREKMAFAELTGEPAGEGPLGYAEAAPKRPAFVPRADDAAACVVKDAELDVVISEKSSKNPDTEGVARVRGLVIFVQGATTVGERVNVRVTDRRERMAFAELTGKPAGEGPLPYVVEARKPGRDRDNRDNRGDRKQRKDAPAAVEAVSAEQVVAGAELVVEIVEESSKNPGQEGIAKVEGLVVAVKGATTVGERVKIRVTDRKARIAFAEAIGPAAE